MAVGLKSPETLLPIAGIRLGATAAGLRYQGRPDLVVVEIEPGANTAAVFTQNRFAAAPVVVAKEHFTCTTPRALLINAGQANAGTGQTGIEVARQSCQLVADRLGCSPESVLPFSTGVIGDAPPIGKIDSALSECIDNNREDTWVAAAHGIMTTDTVAKGCSRTVMIDGQTVTLTGIAKGSGMIRPNMATMLAFVGSDIAMDPALLQRSLDTAITHSFNRITVDGDTSTNDACVLIASGAVKLEPLAHGSAAYQVWVEALCEVLLELAQAIVRDAEGATKFVTVQVEEGTTEDDCLAVAFTVAHSPLTKTALFASDPNWGRILAAVGRAPIDKLDIENVSLHLNGVCVFEKGDMAADYTEETGQAAMAPEEIVIRIGLGMGDTSASVWTSDLSHEYIRINAEYRS
ncbi:MAG: bifunctional glutamate N-acetyltransferase/amino-acid acetyltransferase ArgJ [Acidiferrobacterales bacterium]